MSTTDFKRELHEQIDALDHKHLEEVYGLVLNYLESTEATSDWSTLSLAQKEGIFEAIREMDQGNKVPHNVVMESISKRYKRQ
jgi:predicted transcriptional regulator